MAAAAVALISTPAFAGTIQPQGWGDGTFSNLGMTCNAGHQHCANGNIYMSVCLNINGYTRQAAVIVSNHAPVGSGISVSASTRLETSTGNTIVDCGAKRLDGVRNMLRGQRKQPGQRHLIRNRRRLHGR